MNKGLILFFISIWSHAALGQARPDSLFESGGNLFEQNNLAAAANCYKEIVLNHKSYKYYDQSLYNLAYTYNTMDSADLAIFWYEKVRDSNASDSARVGGRGILEPYANYKHYSTFNIGNLEYNRGNYEKAMEYYKQCQTRYPYYNESGTDLRINKNRVIIFITDCLAKLERYDEALSTILPEALDSYGSSNYMSVVNRTIKLIDEHFDKKQVNKELDEALKTLKPKENERYYTFVWKNKSYNLYPYSLDMSLFLEEIKQSDFWKQLSN